MREFVKMAYWKFWTVEPTSQNYLNFDLCNQLQESCNRLPAKRFQKNYWKSHKPSKIWLCNWLQVSCNWLPVKKFQKIFWKDTSLQTVLNRYNGHIYMYVCMYVCVCVCVLTSKIREFSENLTFKTSLNIFGQTLANYWEFF